MNPLHFSLTKINLIRVGCPRDLQASMGNQRDGLPMVAVANAKRLGEVSTGYAPALILISGDAQRKQLLQRGVIRSWGWVQNGSIEISADDAISCGELMGKLQSELLNKFYGATGPLPSQSYPGIVQVYPFENYLIYEMKGQKFRQGFELNAVERKVDLKGTSVAVMEKFVDAAGDTKQYMPRVQTGVRYAYAPPMGNTQSFTQGGKNSELVLCIIRNWADVEKAANAYVQATKTGLHKPMQPAFYPVNLSDAGKIIASLAAKGIDPFDFARWSVMAQQKNYQTRNGVKLHKSQFAYTPSDDPSTWKLPINTPGRKRDALARINQTQGVKNKSAVLNKVRRAASKSGIDVSDKPTSGQKSWAHKH